MDFRPHPPVSIERAKIEDVEEIARVHLQSAVETYVNEAMGITEEFIRDWRCGSNNEKLLTRIEKSRKYIQNGDASHALFVARQGSKIIGLSSPHIEETGRHRLGPFYVLKEA